MKTVDKVTIIVAGIVMACGVFLAFGLFAVVGRHQKKMEAVEAKAIESRLSLSEHRFQDHEYVTAFVITDSLNGREYLVVKYNTGISVTPIIK